MWRCKLNSTWSVLKSPSRRLRVKFSWRKLIKSNWLRMSQHKRQGRKQNVIQLDSYRKKKNLEVSSYFITLTPCRNQNLQNYCCTIHTQLPCLCKRLEKGLKLKVAKDILWWIKRIAKKKLTRSQNERTTLTVHWKISQLHWTACAYC